MRLDRALEGCRSILVTSHDNPDPDAIVSALLLRKILRVRYNLDVTLGYGGVIGRADNVALVEYAKTEFLRHDRKGSGSHDCIALVDAQPGTGNHRFTVADDVRAVFDHHKIRPQTRRVPFYDIRTQLGATTSVLFQYWRALDIDVTKRYATLISYALRAETGELGREASNTDRDLYRELQALADLRLLASISQAKVGREYFAAVHNGIEGSVIYGRVLVTKLGKLAYPDVVAQSADYFLKFKDADYSFAIGSYEDRILFSVRSDKPNAHLGRLARTIVEGLGTAGGHGLSAGGQVPVDGAGDSKVAQLERRVIRRLLDQLGQTGKRPRKLL